MTKVTQTRRKRTTIGGTVGLAAIGAVAGAVPAHAADGVRAPIAANLSVVKSLLADADTPQSLNSVPVLGTLLPDPTGAVGEESRRLGQRSRPMTLPMPATPSPLVTQSSAVAEGAAAPAVLTTNKLAELIPSNSPVAQMDENSLPGMTRTSNAVSLPLIGGATNAGDLLGTLL